MSTEELPAREAMEFDVVIVGAGPAGLAAAIRLKQLSPDISVVVVEKGSEVGAHILSGAVIDPIGLDRLFRTGATKTRRSRRRSATIASTGCSAARAVRLPQPDAAAADEQSRQLHRLARQCLPLARNQGGSARASKSIPGFAAAEVLFDDNGAVVGVATGDMGVGKDGASQGQLHPRHGAARKIHAVRRRRARQSQQDADRALRSRRRSRAAKIRARPEGAVAGRAGETSAGPGPAHIRLAARQPHRRRFVPLSFRRQSRCGRLRRASQLRKSVSLAVRGIPALQDASAGARHLRGRQAARLWRARDHRGRLAVGAEARLSRAAR